MRVEVIRIETNLKKYIGVAVGIILIIIGFLLLLKYIIDFLKIFVGLIFVIGGIYLIMTHKYVKNFRFFRF